MHPPHQAPTSPGIHLTRHPPHQASGRHQAPTSPGTRKAHQAPTSPGQKSQKASAAKRNKTATEEQLKRVETSDKNLNCVLGVGLQISRHQHQAPCMHNLDTLPSPCYQDIRYKSLMQLMRMLQKNNLSLRR